MTKSPVIIVTTADATATILVGANERKDSPMPRGEERQPTIVEDVKQTEDGASYWMQRLDDLEREIAESSSRLRTARMAFEDVVSDLATAGHKIKELEERLKGRME
jgi:septal ring factor EnvC (AmiA/AmiB activator)